ncbi:phosphotransferase family protein [Rhodocytophaga rosea]|uniref:Phosphotransferase family protein n=1 Tax=Rhodocytophaga rosea TaxID=2704465 RepID=A0A6C0GIB5_9BACT|nr:phosphotransferase family protein [Rhodocytophaga rosea]QHT67738.1 phosphotransferase family protein [Rhodocytophaga rosea]
MPEIIIDSTKPVRQGEAIDLAVLNSYLQEHAPEIGKITSISQFPGGYSNLTYCLHTSGKEYVLRRPPVGANIKSAHDMGREYKVLSLLKPHYDKVPRPVLYCDSHEIMGAPFYMMERISGVILRAASAPSLQLSPEQLRHISESIVDNLVVIHSLDIQTTGLHQLGKPEGYMQRQVEGWSKRYFQAETDRIKEMNILADWLQHHQPMSHSAAFLHNDYKHDNVMLNPENLSQIIGVLDWEMATVGDPLMDVGATLAYWTEAGDSPALRSFNLTWLPGNFTRQEVVEQYAAKSGRDLSNIAFYYIFGLFKNAVIAQQIYTRWKQGLTQDARFESLLFIVKEMAAKALHTLESGKI